jgi:hypothetical protein
MGRDIMRFGRWELTFKSAKDVGAPPSTEDRATNNVEEYYAVSSKTFSAYKTVVGDSAVTYDIIEGLYKKTIMSKVINKLAADSARLGYEAVCVDTNGETHEQAQQIADEISHYMTRKNLKTMYRDMVLYGDAFLYLNKGKSYSGLLTIDDIYPINPRYIEPDVQNQQFKGWKYASEKGQEVPLSFDQLLHVPNNPITGQLFGLSVFEPVLQVLNLILNSQINSAVLLDNFALPLIHWQLDSKHPTKKTPLSEVTKFIRNMGAMTVGSDFVTDSSVDSEVVGAKDKLIDFSPMLDKFDNYFFATAGVPGQVLGFPADNLSAISRQLAVYYEGILDMQETAADILITDLYWKQMANAKVQNLKKITFSYDKPRLEENSRISTWLDTMLRDGVIYKKEARVALGYQGLPPEEPEVQDIPVGNSPEFDKKQNQKTPPGVKQK